MNLFIVWVLAFFGEEKIQRSEEALELEVEVIGVVRCRDLFVAAELVVEGFDEVHGLLCLLDGGTVASDFALHVSNRARRKLFHSSIKNLNQPF